MGDEWPSGGYKLVDSKNDWYSRGFGGWLDRGQARRVVPEALGGASMDPDGWNDSLNTP